MFVEALRFAYAFDFRPKQKMGQTNGAHHGPGLSSFTKTIIPIEISRASSAKLPALAGLRFLMETCTISD